MWENRTILVLGGTGLTGRAPTDYTEFVRCVAAERTGQPGVGPPTPVEAARGVSV